MGCHVEKPEKSVFYYYFMAHWMSKFPFQVKYLKWGCGNLNTKTLQVWLPW